MTANKELSTRNQEMADLVAMRERMLSIIAHDLRNPIGNLNQLLEMIQTASLSEQDAEIFELCRTSATEAYSLLENLLNWARKQSKVANIKRETIDLHLLIWNSIRLYKAGLHKKKLDINIDVDPTHTAFCDTAMLDTVVRNLISNAIKFTPIHGLISIKTEVDDDKVNIKITDTGIGINEETIHKILETNQYFTTLGTDKEKGSGLGLMICKEFIERNNGSIKVESELNVGTSFTVVLPITNETLKTMNPV
jgi:signal transduction histidine kinase